MSTWSAFTDSDQIASSPMPVTATLSGTPVRAFSKAAGPSPKTRTATTPPPSKGKRQPEPSSTVSATGVSTWPPTVVATSAADTTHDAGGSVVVVVVVGDALDVTGGD